MSDLTIWQWLAFAVSFAAFATGVTIATIVGVTEFLEWLYRDKRDKESPDERAYLDAIEGAEADWLAECSRRGRDHLGAFGAGRVVGHPSRGSHD